MINRAMLAAVLLAGLPALAWAEDAAQSQNAVQSADVKIEQCLSQSRQTYPDVTAHDKRIVTATQCICTQAPDVCNHSQMIQDFRLRQRLLDDK